MMNSDIVDLNIIVPFCYHCLCFYRYEHSF
jgi:hypothetical protein